MRIDRRADRRGVAIAAGGACCAQLRSLASRPLGLPCKQTLPDRPIEFTHSHAINAVHADAATVEQTDWSQIVVLYDQLLAVAPTPVVALNRA